MRNRVSGDYLNAYKIAYQTREARIEYCLDKDNDFGGTIDIASDRDEKVTARFEKHQKNFALFTLQSIVLEKDSTVEEYEDEFLEYAKEKLEIYLARIIFQYCQQPQSVTTEIEVKPILGDWKSRDNKAFVTQGVGAVEVHKVLSQFPSSDYQQLFSWDKKEVDDLIGSYLLFRKLPDPVLRLVHFYAFYEFLGNNIGEHDHEGDSGIERNSPSTRKRYYKDGSGKHWLKIDYWTIAARNLVVHGSADMRRDKREEKVVKELNDRLNTPKETCHRFDRNNKQHIELVKEAGDKFASVISAYIHQHLRNSQSP